MLWALAAFGAPISILCAEDDFNAPDHVVQLGVSPCLIDLLTSIYGVAFEEAWPERNEVMMGALTVPVISRRHLVQNKRATERLQDRADVARLEREGI